MTPNEQLEIYAGRKAYFQKLARQQSDELRRDYYASLAVEAQEAYDRVATEEMRGINQQQGVSER